MNEAEATERKRLAKDFRVLLEANPELKEEWGFDDNARTLE